MLSLNFLLINWEKKMLNMFDYALFKNITSDKTDSLVNGLSKPSSAANYVVRIWINLLQLSMHFFIVFIRKQSKNRALMNHTCNRIPLIGKLSTSSSSSSYCSTKWSALKLTSTQTIKQTKSFSYKWMSQKIKELMQSFNPATRKWSTRK